MESLDMSTLSWRGKEFKWKCSHAGLCSQNQDPAWLGEG